MTTNFIKSYNANGQATEQAEKAKYYLNVSLNGKQLGYLVLDKFPQLTEKLAANPELANKLLQNCEATFRVRNDKPAEFDLSFLD